MYISYLVQDRAFIKPLAVTGDFPNGDLDVNLAGQQTRIPRFLATTPIQVCDQCYKPMIMKKVYGQGTLIQCPNFLLHQAEGHSQLGINPELSRAERRKHLHLARGYRRQASRKKN